VAAIGGALLAPCVVDFLRYGSPFEYFRRRAFDRRAWQAAGPDADRTDMIDDLVDHVLRVGMTRSEVDALLGPATRTEKFREWDLVYWVGPERSLFSIDSEWLVIRLARDDTVTEFAIVRD
jgi:hypothetical protein